MNLNHLQEGQANHQVIKPRAEFDYEHPRLWVKRCEKYFMLSQILAHSYLDYLTMYLTKKVGVWFEGYMNGMRGRFVWDQFVRALYMRFRMKCVSIEEKFTALKQVESVDEFTKRYVELRGLMLQEHPYLTENYFLNHYIFRLKHVIRCFVRTSRPAIFGKAIWLAKKFEQGMKSPNFFPKRNHSGQICD